MRVFKLLRQARQLKANVAFEDAWAQPDAPGCRPPDWAHYLVDKIPAPVVMSLAGKGIQDYSREIGHSLAYELHWREEALPALAALKHSGGSALPLKTPVAVGVAMAATVAVTFAARSAHPA